MFTNTWCFKVCARKPRDIRLGKDVSSIALITFIWHYCEENFYNLLIDVGSCVMYQQSIQRLNVHFSLIQEMKMFPCAFKLFLRIFTVEKSDFRDIPKINVLFLSLVLIKTNS